MWLQPAIFSIGTLHLGHRFRLSGAWLNHAFLEFLITLHPSLIHFTRKTIMKWFVAFCTCYDTKLTTEVRLAIFGYVVHHITI